MGRRQALGRRGLLLVLAAVLLTAGLVVGLSPWGDDACGSVLLPGRGAEDSFTVLSARPGGPGAPCDQQLGHAGPATYGLLGLSGVAALLAIAVGGSGLAAAATSSARRTAATDEPFTLHPPGTEARRS